ncbi:MAG: hypothetical protein ACPGC2_00085 [Flavobacteriaceae bacterium]
MSRFVRFSFFMGVFLGLVHFLFVIGKGSILAGIFWGLIPVWFWATFQKLKQNAPVKKLEGVAAYFVVLYGGVLALVAVVCVIASIGFWVLDPEIIQAAVEQQPNYEDLSEDELQVIAKLPSIMPLFTLGICLQSVSNIVYGLAVVRNYSR